MVSYIKNIRFYLDDLENCSCAPTKYIEIISFYESLLLIAEYIIILFNIGSIFIPSIFNPNNIPKYGVFMYIIAVIILHCLFIYNVYEFHRGIKKDCKCVNSNQKTRLYLQTVYYGGMLVVILILGLIILLRRLK